MSSLRGRLLVGVAVCTVLAWCGMAALSYQLAKRQLSEDFDTELAEAVALLLDLLPADIDSATIPRLLQRQTPDGSAEHATHRASWAFQVVLDGRLRLAHGPWPPAGAEGFAPGFSHLRIEGRQWRAYTQTRDRLRVTVAESLERRDAMIRSAAFGQLMPLLLFLPVVLFTCALAIRYSLRDVDRLSAELTRRAPDKLTALDVGTMPLELLPVVMAINRLFERLADALERESSFTGNAAHEMRTPLAAIRTQVEVALALDGDRQRHALGRVLEGVDRLTRLLNQLLLLARIESREPDLGKTVDAGRLFAEVVEDLGSAAAERRVELAVAATTAPAGVRGDAALLRMAIDNLVRNALRYAPPRSRVELAVDVDAGVARLCVRDRGPGLSPEIAGKASHRFYRAPDAIGSGSGLGLAIVERIARLHDGHLSLEPGAGGVGLAACLYLPCGPAGPGDRPRR